MSEAATIEGGHVADPPELIPDRLADVREVSSRLFLRVVFVVTSVASLTFAVMNGLNYFSATHPFVTMLCLLYGWRTKNHRLPMLVFILYTLALIPVFAGSFGSGAFAPATRWLPLFPLATAFLLGGRTTWIITVLTLVCFGFIATTQGSPDLAATTRQTMIVVPASIILAGVVAYMFDQRVTVALRTIEEQSAKNAALATELAARNERIAAKNEDLELFNRVAAHDLRGPASRMVGFSSLLAEDLEEHLDDETRLALGHLQDGARRLVDVVDGLSRWVRIDSEHTLESFESRALLDDVEATLAATIEEHGATVQRGVSFERFEASSLFGQVLTNLVQNAIKYRRPDVAPRIEVRGEETDDAWIWRVVDNGAGIAEEHWERVFEPFSRVTTKGVEGTGLGLALVRRIVERQGGRVAIEASSATGTTVAVWLPKRGG